MGWFDEQIRQRKESDRELFEDSILTMASAVVGRSAADALRDGRILTKAAIDEILKYYHFKPADIPSSIKDPEEQLEYALRPHGLAYRRIRLTEDWYSQTFGPILAFRRADGRPVVLLPRRYGGYTWPDAEGKSVSADKKTAEALLPEALCFYRPLPLKPLGISDLLDYMKDCLRFEDYAVLVGLTLLTTLIGMLLPRVTKFLSGYVLESGNERILWSTAIFLICVLVTSQLFSASRSLAMSRLQIKVALPMEAAMMLRLLSLPTRFFREYSAGELASRAGAVNRLSSLLLGSVFSLGLTALSSLLYIRLIFRYAPALGKPALLVVLATVAVSLLTAFLKAREEREYMKAAAEEAGVSYAIISGIQKIKLSGAEKRAFARWARVYAAGAEIEYNPPLFLKLNAAIMTSIPFFGMVAIYYSAAQSGVDPSSYLAFSAAYGAVTGAFGAFAQSAAAAAQIQPILEMAEPILQSEPEIAEGREIVTRLTGSIELSGVSFRYREDAPWLLDGLDLKIKSGEYVAVVGRTGCGKSTLIRLLLGFETPEKGAVFYDRKDLRTLDPRSLRRKMGVVIQDGSLFLGDIFSNITVSAPGLSLEEAWEAAEIAGIAEDIRAMPMGMHTVIGEGQGGISGGQKQRILIARAIAPKPKILIFDEATSALDNRTQRQVAEALDRLNCTRIVIAHRLSTVKNCDRILVLDGGRIIEEGSYEALMERGGVFAELVERQKL